MYGTFVFLSESALITLPSVNKDLFMFAVYFAISPCDLDYFNL